MQSRRMRFPGFGVVALGLLCAAMQPVEAAGSRDDIRKGEPLSAALQVLRDQGLQLIFSTALVGPELTVQEDPGTGTPEDIARRILAPHDLTLEVVRPGVYAIVRAAAKSEPRAATSASTAVAQPSSAQQTVQRLDEVDIYASRYEIESQQSPVALTELTREDIEALPGLNEDVLRVTRFLPGTAANALSARSHVRGGRDDEVAVFFDGVPLFEPFHFKDVQSVLGMLDPESISKIDFFSGVFPARYGNRLSGVLDIQPRMGGESHHSIGASVLYSHAMTEGQLGSYPVQWLASVRNGNVDLIADQLEEQSVEPKFLDALGRVQIDFTPQVSLVGGWLLLDDSLEASLANGSERGEVSYRDATGWSSLRWRPSDSTDVRATVSRTERHTNRNGSVDQPGNSLGSVNDRRTFDTNTVRLEARAWLDRQRSVTGGVEWYDHRAAYEYRSERSFDPLLAAALNRPVAESLATALRVGGESYAAYASVLLAITRNTSLDLALRWDAERFDAAAKSDQLSPRVSVLYQYDPLTALRVSWGQAAQPLRPDELQVQDGDSSFHATQHATQTAISLERRFRSSALLRLEAYDKRVRDPAPFYENLLDPFALFPELEADRVRIQPDRSHLYGAELSLRWQHSDTWSGWTNYTWSQATDELGPVSVPRTWDQRSALTTGLTWQKRRWQIAANLTWHSGWRRNQLDLTSTGIELQPRNSSAWPAYVSLDSRLTWTRPLPRGSLVVYGEIDNLTRHGNPCCSTYEVEPASGSGNALIRDDSTWLPQLLLFGVTWQLP